jgi:phosphocarrier protein
MSDETLVSKTVTICNKRGLHARASAKFVTLASSLEATIMVAKDGNEVSGISILEIMMLGAAMGDQITIIANGPNAEAALAQMAELVENRFGED